MQRHVYVASAARRKGGPFRQGVVRGRLHGEQLALVFCHADCHFRGQQTRVLMPWFGDVWAFRRRLQSLGLAEASKLTMVSRTTMAAKINQVEAELANG